MNIEFMSKNQVRNYDNYSSFSLGPNLFDAMMFSFGNSMARKRFDNELETHIN